MVRTQVQLTEEQITELRRLAAARGTSVAEVVRDAVDALLRGRLDPSWDERKRRALAAVGKHASGLRDVSTEHDRYLEEAYRT
jgi:Arc/MetJ-type ribon-helix-helix transcriptional regulator